jgi:hypothetical protein
MFVRSERESLETIASEQRDLVERLDGLRLWWAEIAVDETLPIDQLLSRLHGLRVTLASHFEREEATEHASACDTDPSQTSAHLDDQIRTHALLVAELDQMIMRMRACRPGMDCWAGVSKAFNSWLARFSAHEQQELAEIRRLEESRGSTAIG